MLYLSLFLNVIFGIGLLVMGFILYRNNQRTKQKIAQLRKANAEKERIGSDLRLASQIQLSMLPIGHMIQENVELFGSLVPAREMGGDLFDHYIRDEKLYFCIGDVCGKGAPAAMFMAYAHSMLWGFTRHESNPARIVHSLNQVASYNNESCTFFTLFYGVLDLPTGRLHYCNAGHNPPYILSDKLMKLDCDPNQPIGPIEDAEFSLQTTTLSPGSTIFLYTDGLTEANNTEKMEFGPERTENVLRECLERQLKPEEIVNTITETVHQFTMGAEQSDDLTMLAVRYTPKIFESKLTETITLKNNVSEVTRLGSFQDSVYAKMNIDESLTRKLRLAVEEAVVNVIEHAYSASRVGNIEVKMMTDGQLLKVQIIDSGVAFDPTTVARADTTLSAKERQFGGLGLLLVRELMDSINYERIDDQNILTLNKKI